ncbi:MAG: helix-turn-helix domain-containing protein [Actinomycetota bacterium]|nr:helix-turn-helix domain-containing protein [Euzebyales bacterium]MDQ3344067.1 helix-turn-helix domain-containing protein [Actinomycetota bacterium]MDQ3529234.1 helix-turn-helix domain-containing protein [Actinomycetota bacterium]
MLTVPQAAKRVGKNPETVRRWIRSGRLRSQLVGTQHLVREEDVDAFGDDPTMQLPASWLRTDAGEPMPEWERLVRDGRRSH